MFNYITAASGMKFIANKAQYAVKSLLRSGISADDVHVVVNTKEDKSLFMKLVPSIKRMYVLNADMNKYRWGYMGGKRRYAPLKPLSILHVFPGGDSNPVVMFDGDVLWYKDPTPFLSRYAHKTWFHHGKDLGKRAARGENPIKKEDVDITNLKSLSRWCRYAFAYLLIHYKVKKLPEREVCSGFYILRPEDTHRLPKWDLRGCDILARNKALRKHESAGEQCPLNAALCKLEIDWHGGSRFLCREHEEYFDHFFGDIKLKSSFDKRVKKMRLNKS